MAPDSDMAVSLGSVSRQPSVASDTSLTGSSIGSSPAKVSTLSIWPSSP